MTLVSQKLFAQGCLRLVEVNKKNEAESIRQSLAYHSQSVWSSMSYLYQRIFISISCQMLPDAQYSKLKSYSVLFHLSFQIQQINFNARHVDYEPLRESTFQIQEKNQASNQNPTFLALTAAKSFIKSMYQSNKATSHLIEILAKSDRCFQLIVNLKYVLMSFKWLELPSADATVTETVKRIFRAMTAWKILLSKWYVRRNHNQ